jgi:hypothetical protein
MRHSAIDTLTHSWQILLVGAYHNGEMVAGALNLIGDDAIYGRNWGCDSDDFKNLHFEVYVSQFGRLLVVAFSKVVWLADAFELTCYCADMLLSGH